MKFGNLRHIFKESISSDVLTTSTSHRSKVKVTWVFCAFLSALYQGAVLSLKRGFYLLWICYGIQHAIQRTVYKSTPKSMQTDPQHFDMSRCCTDYCNELSMQQVQSKQIEVVEFWLKLQGLQEWLRSICERWWTWYCIHGCSGLATASVAAEQDFIAASAEAWTPRLHRTDRCTEQRIVDKQRNVTFKALASGGRSSRIK